MESTIYTWEIREGDGNFGTTHVDTWEATVEDADARLRGVVEEVVRDCFGSQDPKARVTEDGDDEYMVCSIYHSPDQPEDAEDGGAGNGGAWYVIEAIRLQEGE